MNTEQIDLSKVEYETWLSLLFESPRAWADDALNFTISYESIIVDYFARMCTEFKSIAHRYNLAQIDNGIWRTFDSSAIEPAIVECLVVPSLVREELSKQIKAIESIYFVYADFVSVSTVEVMENCFDMWWCDLTFTFWTGSRSRHSVRLTPDDYSSMYPLLPAAEKEILDAIFRTLVKILSLEDDRTKSWALHGLSNCHHPGVKPTVQAIIDQHLAHYKDDVEFIEWLELCRDGKIP